MKTAKNMGIWMDHSVAHLMELENDNFKTSTIKSEFTPEEKKHSMGKGEYHMHNKEQHQQSNYYKKIAEAIKDHKEIVLFGPTDAKVELSNLLKADHQFEKVKIEIRDADKMTENQQEAFVKKHFQIK